MPFLAVASQPRCFNGKNGADLTLADIGHQGLEPLALHVSASRAAKIVVDNAHVCPAMLLRALHQGVLAPLALDVVLHLCHGRLAHVDVGGSFQMCVVYLTHLYLLARWVVLGLSPRWQPSASQ